MASFFKPGALLFIEFFDQNNTFSSLPLEGKVPSAHTGRMRWKCCVSAGSGKVAPPWLPLPRGAGA